MRKRGVYILLLLFIVYNTALNEMLKLPTLVAHFLEHRERNGNISVAEFLCMHYWGKDINDNDEERDRQLPYKNINVHTISHSFIPLAKTVTLKHHDCQSQQVSYPFITVNNIPDPALASLFRPPRV